jgi:hypothetical protein
MSVKTQAENIHNKVINYMESLSNKELSDLIDELSNDSYDENSLIRKAVVECFGEENILVLQVNQLLFPLLKEINDRFKSISNNQI